MTGAPFTIRDGEDADSAAVIALIGAVFDEYPGCVLAVDAEMPELHRPASAFAARGGRFWVAEGEGDPEPRVIGCVGLRPAADGAGVELCKLYVARGARRRGLGSALCGLVEAEAQARGAASVELWTDTRFADAHRLYERRGYQRGPATRELHDLSHTVEYSYRLDLSGAKRGSLQGAP